MSETKKMKNAVPEREPYKAWRALQALRELNEHAKRNGLSNMTLEEINAEIYAARRERELRETEERLQ